MDLKKASKNVPEVAEGGASAQFQPLYQQIKQLIVGRLQSGEWKPGDAIPSEQELAARFGVSQGTARKAVDMLAAENLVNRRQGKGTFVAAHAEARAQARFLRLMPDAGAAEHPESHIAGVARVKASAAMAAQLRLRAGATVIEIRRTLRYQGEVAVLDIVYLPAQAFKGLTEAKLVGSAGEPPRPRAIPLYSLFESEFGIKMVRAEEVLRAVAASAEIAHELGVSEGSPILSVERLSYTFGDVPMEVRHGFYRTDRYHYRNDLA